MPGGETHLRFYKMGTMIAIPLSVYIFLENPVIGFGTLLGYGLGFLCDPDWDIYSASATESRIIKYLPFAGYILYGYTSIFGAIFRKHHRSIWTHGYFLGAIVRLVYLFWWLGILYYKNIIHFEIWQLYLYIGLFLGLSIADSFHITTDLIWSETHFKKKMK